MKILGKNPSGSHKVKVQQSTHFIDGAFKNIVETAMMAKDATPIAMLKDLLNPPANRAPSLVIPSVKTDLYQTSSDKPVITWFGHSSYHISVAGKKILVDPVFSGNASPFTFMIKSFAGSDIYKPADFKDIDVLILTHDHYDHLDYKTLVQLKDKVKFVCCSLGVASHLTHWGFDKKKITELDWWQSAKFENLKLTATPARHFSGRMIKRGQTLWSAFVLEVNEYQLFLGGDSGYGDHFREIGKRFGGFDIAILECGQYNTKWPMIHMMPEETVQANIDLQSKVLMPVHWGKFALAFHPWNEPASRAIDRAKQLSIKYTVPKIGESIIVGDTLKVEEWWKVG